MRYIVKLEANCWLARWGGDPGRTLVEENAKRYPSLMSATYALANARRFRDFKGAQILEVSP